MRKVFYIVDRASSALPDDSEGSWHPQRPCEAQGEHLKLLHQRLREKLKVEGLAKALGLGLVRVFDKLDRRHRWVYPLYADLYGGSA